MAAAALAAAATAAGAAPAAKAFEVTHRVMTKGTPMAVSLGEMCEKGPYSAHWLNKTGQMVLVNEEEEEKEAMIAEVDKKLLVPFLPCQSEEGGRVDLLIDCGATHSLCGPEHTTFGQERTTKPV